MNNFCGKCGTQLNEGDLFCKQCGAKIEEPSPIAKELLTPPKSETEKGFGDNKTDERKLNIVAPVWLIISISALVLAIILFISTFVSGPSAEMYRYIRTNEYEIACTIYEEEIVNKTVQKTYLNIFLHNYSDELINLYKANEISYYYAQEILIIMEDVRVPNAENTIEELKDIHQSKVISEEKQKELYQKFINEECYLENDDDYVTHNNYGNRFEQYAFYDIDNDGILELIITYYSDKKFNSDNQEFYLNLVYTLNDSCDKVVYFDKFLSQTATLYECNNGYLCDYEFINNKTIIFLEKTPEGFVRKYISEIISDKKSEKVEYKVTKIKNNGSEDSFEILSEAEYNEQFNMCELQWVKLKKDETDTQTPTADFENSSVVDNLTADNTNYKSIIQKAISRNNNDYYDGAGFLYDIDGNGIDELVLVYQIDKPLEVNPSTNAPTVVCSVYSQSDDGVAIIMEEETLYVAAGGPHCMVKVVKENNETYLAIGANTGSQHRDVNWQLYTIDGTSMHANGTSVNYNTDYGPDGFTYLGGTINGKECTYEEVTQWENSLQVLSDVNYEQFNDSDNTSLSELLKEIEQ